MAVCWRVLAAPLCRLLSPHWLLFLLKDPPCQQRRSVTDAREVCALGMGARQMQHSDQIHHWHGDSLMPCAHRPHRTVFLTFFFARLCLCAAFLLSLQKLSRVCKFSSYLQLFT
jgi:hypothetical protein